jgi:competence protein ComEA
MAMYLSRRQTLAVVVLLSLCAVGGGILVWRQATRGTVTVTQPEAASPAVSRREEVVVHVCGAVKAPGVYRLPAEARIYEAIDRAGGALPEADQEAVNLAARVKDGEQIRLPRKGEIPPPTLGRMPAMAGNGNGRPVTAAQKPEVKLPLHLNQASATELEAVPGIGPVLAARIDAYRRANGPYAAVEDLLNVPGIGEKTLTKLRPYLLVP